MINKFPSNSTESAFYPVSVVVPIYNGEADVPDLISCLKGQTYPREKVEYLLVDNNSSDRTLDLLKDVAQGADFPLHPLSETEIQSSYAARNTGIRAARHDLLAFTDADCRPESTWLENLVKPFQNPEVGLVAGEIQALAPKTFLERYAERYKVLSQTYTLEHPFCPYGQTANLAVRREAFVKVGLFRPYLTTGGDADMCWRILRQTDWKLEFAETAVVRHRHRATLEELYKQWRRYGQSNRYLHELHGVDLQPEKSLEEATRQILRWMVKEFPVSMAKWILGKGTMVEMWASPIGWYTGQARSRGQQDAKLPEIARKIEWLEDSPPPAET
ncbi:glycosyltransferase [Baaleninema sp.]|uniref:glycosyltransferase n=1 Tax=Baaleninema sp. TaxID=3101197 RepID=UPI003D04C36F